MTQSKVAALFQGGVILICT